MQCGELKSISIPSSIESIGDYSFYGCSNLINISIQKQRNLKEIGEHAFYNCSNLERITFCGCIKLSSISIPSTIQYIDDYGFYNCSILKNIIIPSSIKSIGDYSF